MHTVSNLKVSHGDYTGLAADYARYRPGYAPRVATAIVSLLAHPVAEIDAADVGAGTGIWTRILAGCGLRSIVENPTMRCAAKGWKCRVASPLRGAKARRRQPDYRTPRPT